jgi:hypothetical protein
MIVNCYGVFILQPRCLHCVDVEVVAMFGAEWLLLCCFAQQQRQQQQQA